MSYTLSKDNVKEFTFAGNATITLRSGNTDKHYTYKITAHKEDNNLFFVRLLNGPDNEDDYSYIGCYYKDTQIFNPCKTWKNKANHCWPPSLRAIKYFFDKIDGLPDNLHVYHEGKCAKCGRKLTTPESLETGFGPECRRTVR